MSSPIRVPASPRTHEWRPIVFRRSNSEDVEKVNTLKRSGDLHVVHDTLASQLQDLARRRSPRDPIESELKLREAVERILAETTLERFGRWVYYPWSQRLVAVLPPNEFQELRLDRNRHVITDLEQQQLAKTSIGVVGLSVGSAVALTLSIEGSCGHLKLADHDVLSLSNMNRIRASVYDLDLPKAVLAARQIYEINPYADVSVWSDGVNAQNIDAFLNGMPKLDLVIDECDDFEMKVAIREKARAFQIPVLMATSDRGMIDVERFDLEPSRPLLHGMLGGLTSDQVRAIPKDDRVGFVVDILGPDALSARAGGSLLEIGDTLSTWPQIASEVCLGAAALTGVVRMITLGKTVSSGRYFVDLEGILTAKPNRLKPSILAEGLLETAISVADAEPFRSCVQSIPVTPNHPGEDDSKSMIRSLTAYGTRAPSAGNNQPWQFYSDGKRLWLSHNYQRSRNLMDPTHHAAYVGLGAAIENIRLAAANRGLLAQIDRRPISGSQNLVAEISFEEQRVTSNPEDRELFGQIDARVTNRRVVLSNPLHPSLISHLQSSIGGHNDRLPVRMEVMTDRHQLAELGQIVGASDRIRLLSPHLHREMMSEIRWTLEDEEKTGDGLLLETLELSSAQKSAFRVLARGDVAAALKESGGGATLERISASAIKSAAAICLLSANDSSLIGALEVGGALERVWLRAAGLGVGLQPIAAMFMFQMLDGQAGLVFDRGEKSKLLTLRARVDELFQKSNTRPLLLLRLTLAPAPRARSRRLLLDRVLQFGKEAPDKNGVDA